MTFYVFYDLLSLAYACVLCACFRPRLTYNIWLPALMSLCFLRSPFHSRSRWPIRVRCACVFVTRVCFVFLFSEFQLCLTSLLTIVPIPNATNAKPNLQHFVFPPSIPQKKTAHPPTTSPPRNRSVRVRPSRPAAPPLPTVAPIAPAPAGDRRRAGADPAHQRHPKLSTTDHRRTDTERRPGSCHRAPHQRHTHTQHAHADHRSGPTAAGPLRLRR